MVDRSGYRVRKISLDEEGRDPEIAKMTPAARIEMVWQLTLQAWAFKEGRWDEPRLQRHVVRVVRGAR
jgi:hypothetical protein